MSYIDAATLGAPSAVSIPVAERVLSGPRSGATLMPLVPASEWDAMLPGLDGACQEQTLAYASRRWPHVGFEPRVFVRDGEFIGATLMMIQRLPLGVGSVAISKWGPMLKAASAADADHRYADMIDALVAEYAGARRMMLSILPRAPVDGRNAEFDHLAQRGFQAGSNVGFPNRYIVDLRVPDDQHRRRLQQKWRYHLGKSEKAGLTFEEAGPERLGEFTALYDAMSERKRFPDYSACHTIPALMEMDDEALRPALFFVREGGEIVAGAIIFKAGDTASYLYGATNDRALPLRAGYFMHWEIIRWLKRNTRALWYDLGGSDGFAGLHQFKKGMVGDAGVVSPLPPMANYAASPLPFWLGTGAFAARDALQKLRALVLLRWGGMARPDLSRSETPSGDG